jgi:hypothetical protein
MTTSSSRPSRLRGKNDFNREGAKGAKNRKKIELFS